MSGRPAKARRYTPLRLPTNVYEPIRRFAWNSNRSINELVTDLLTTFILAAIDPDDPDYSTEKMGVALPDPVPERYPGYRESLIFTIAEDNG